MLQITPEATSHLRRLREQRGMSAGAAARLERAADGRLRLRFVEEPQAGDQVLEEVDPRVFIASDVASVHDRWVIDATTSEGRTHLKVLRSRAATGAGAGASARTGAGASARTGAGASAGS